jgi:copper chaperone CopZ
MRPSTVAAVALITLPLTGCAGDAEPPADAVTVSPAANETVLHFDVQGMSCSGCENAIVSKLTDMPAVTACTASHESGTAEVTVTDPSVQTAIAGAIVDLGYEVVVPD